MMTNILRDEQPDSIAHDVGVKVLTDIFAELAIDEEWAVHEPRAFRWFGHRLEQRFPAGPMTSSRGFMVSRVRATTKVIEHVGASPSVVNSVLANLNRHSLRSAYVYSERDRSVNAFAHCFVHEETAQFRQHQIAAFGIMQLCLAETEADYLADALAGTVATRAHPTNGPRSTPDEMVSVLDALFAVQGSHASRFESADAFSEVEAMVNLASAATFGSTETGIAFEVMDGDTTSLIRMHSDRPHRRAGQGLSAELHLRDPSSFNECADVAALLNRAEASLSETHFYGSWCVAPVHRENSPHVTYRCFFPNALFNQCSMVDVAQSMLIRARWVSELRHPNQSGRDPWAVIAERLGYRLSENEAR